MDHPVFDHEGPWTEDAYLALPRDGRIEVVDGTLLVGPGTTQERARVVRNVREAVQSALPEGLAVVGPVRLRLGPDCVLQPDLVVTAASDPDETGDDTGDEPADVLEAAAALMVIEVVGREHGATDRSFKPQLYARSRIPYSMLIDHDSAFGVVDMIINGRYHEYARSGADQSLLIEEPFRLQLDLAAVTRAPVTAMSETDAAGGTPPDAGVRSEAEAPATQ